MRPRNVLSLKSMGGGCGFVKKHDEIKPSDAPLALRFFLTEGGIIVY